jgi:lipopolysaccharide export system protein LptC
MRAHIERLVLLGVLGVMAGLGIWMQVNLLEPAETETAAPLSNEPDYYIQNFTATGRDEAGIVYVLKAQRLTHYPSDNHNLLDKPHLVQYQEGKPARQATSESGWMAGDGSEVLLTGNVEVTQFRNDEDPGSVTRTKRLTVRLDRGS